MAPQCFRMNFTMLRLVCHECIAQSLEKLNLVTP